METNFIEALAKIFVSNYFIDALTENRVIILLILLWKIMFYHKSILIF